VERWGRRWYRWGLRLLPEWLREESGPDMVTAFLQGQRAALEGGLSALIGFWLRELGGLLRTAWAARHPDRWTQRTVPDQTAHAHRPFPSHRPDMDNVRQDIRSAIRTFVRRPALLLLSVFTLALGIGSSTAMFSVIDSVLLRPLDYPEPSELHAVYPAWPQLVGHPTLGDLALRGTWSWPEFWLVAEQQEVFERVGAFSTGAVTLTSDESRPERISVVNASLDVLPALGATTRLGRIFEPGDGSDEDRVVMLTHGTWRDRYGGDPNIVGRTIRLNGGSYEVIGVLTEDFELTGVTTSLWLPTVGSSTDAGLGNHGTTRAIGRLAEGVTKDQARAEVARILQSLPPEHGEHDATVEPLQAELTRNVRPALMIMLAASGLLLLVACGNVAALLVGAGIERERDLAVRGAVGASRGRLSQQLLTESAILALLGAAGGILLATLTTRALAFLAPPDVPRLAEVVVDGRILGFAIALSVVCGIASGLVPALSLSATELAGSMGTLRTLGGRRARLQAGLVAGELALATVLLVGGVLLTRTVSALNRVDPGFDHEGLVNVSIALPSNRFRDEEGAFDSQAAWTYQREIADALSSLPGVQRAVTASAPPFFGWRANNGVLPEAWPDPDNPPVAERRFVSPGYFHFMGIPILEGREFEPAEDDPEGDPVVIVSRGLAELAWPGESAVGKRLEYFDNRDARVVGVAGDIRDEQLQRTTELAFYAPTRQGGGAGWPLIVRTASGGASDLIPGIRERIWSVDPDLPITRAVTTEELMADQLAEQLYRARLMTVFAGLAGFFAMLGIYGVTSRSVRRRTREMGLRVALGAERSQVRRMVTVEAMRLALVGVVLGLVGALAVGGALERFLWGVTRTDPLTLVAVGLGLPLLAGLAALPPARRATRVDPLVALRAE
jgi:putative ABC transport system permease protein